VKEEDLYQEQCTSHYRKKPGRKENYNPIHQGHETKEKHRHPPWPMAELHPPTDADEEPQSMDTAARPSAWNHRQGALGSLNEYHPLQHQESLGETIGHHR
jgi:hypothetical protein